VKTILLESLLVALAGALLAFGANAVSNRGLALGRNYFELRIGGEPATPTSQQGNASAQVPSALQSLAAQGVRLADSNQVAQLFRDPRLEQGLVAFLDARDDEHYESGHIPGAWQFDSFHAENYMTSVMPVCQLAQEVVVYCNGGNCEDSAFATSFLVSAGIAKEKLSVYPGGITEWSTNRMPIEVGVRNSGRLAGGAK
jgi:rhodanese-related sulfurtransferase